MIAAENAREAAQALAAQQAAQLAAQQAEAAREAQEAAQVRIQITYSGSHEDWMSEAGISPSDYMYVDYIVSHESGWRYSVVNSEGSGATGLCQALPGSKMASAGADYLTNPVTQLRWCSSYAQSRYGSWANAYTVWSQQYWW